MSFTEFLPDHIIRMTDDIGIMEHCIFATPDPTEGYCTDDNARALLVALRISGRGQEKIQKLLPIFLKFLIGARTPKGFHQDLNSNLTWKNDDGTGEGFGRAMAALGEAAISAPTDDQKLTSAFVFDQQIPLVSKVDQPRAIAQVIIGISHRVKFETTYSNLVPLLIMRKKLKGDIPEKLPLDLKREMARLADKLIINYQKSSTESWKWYEGVLSYDNGRIPLSLFYAYRTIGDKKYLRIAKESLDFLLEQTYDTTKDCFSFPGYRGWFPKNGKKAVFGQQPIEAGSTTEACLLAYEITGEKNYHDFGIKAFEWYSGRNINKTSLYDNKSKGIKDGLESWGVNPNEGAESILSYALAYNAIKKAGK